MPADHSAMKLGRLPAKIDPRVPKLSQYLTSKLPVSPPVCDWSLRSDGWDMLANDRIGDCTAVGCANSVSLWTANASKEVSLTEQDVIEFYSRSCGYDPSNPDTDRGGVEVDVLRYWHENSIAGHPLDAFAVLDVGNRANIKDAIWLCGVAYLGINLPLSAQTQELWDIPEGGAIGDGEPGSWGGHCVIAVGYNDKGLTIVTWGQTKFMTWDFFNVYCEEAYALLSKEWIKQEGVSPSGFNYPALIKDMRQLGDNPMERLHETVDDPVLLELHWRDVTIDVKWAAATWFVGLIFAAILSAGQGDASAWQTWVGGLGTVAATWLNLTRVHHNNISTRDLVDAFVEVIQFLQDRKKAPK